MPRPTPGIAIIDYGLGNVGSVSNMLRRAGLLAQAVDDPVALSGYSRAILPGVGHFATAMDLLHSKGWTDVIRDYALVQKKPFLGVCLGMQLLGRRSEEGDADGLGLIDGDIVYFNRTAMTGAQRIPHMGWADVMPRGDKQLFPASDYAQRFYFVHSLHFSLANSHPAVAATCHYGYEFVCAVEDGNVMGVQFHPEKSHMFGMDMLRRFAGARC
jgi:imidazole glycerol-phosphate synthase subunit HisH